MPARAADAVVPQHVGLGSWRARSLDCGAAKNRHRDRRRDPRRLSPHARRQPADAVHRKRIQCARAVGFRKMRQPYVKDAFHRCVIHGEQGAVNPEQCGTKACAWYRLDLAPGETRTIRLRLTCTTEPTRMVKDIDGLFAERILEADEFYFSARAISPWTRGASSGRLSPGCCGPSSFIIAGNRACADIGPLADRRIADIA